MLYSKLAYTLALVSAVVASTSSLNLAARQEEDCSQLCATLDVLENFNCVPTKPGCEYCAAVKGMLDDIEACYRCVFTANPDTDREPIQKAYEETAATCKEVDVEFDAPNFTDLPTGEGDGGAVDEPQNGSPATPEDSQGAEQDAATEGDQEGGAVQSAVSVLAVGAMLTFILM